MMTNLWGTLFSTWKAIVPQNPFHCCPHQVAVILCEVSRSVALTSALTFVIIHWISVSWCIQNHCSTTMSTCFSSFTLKSTVRNNIYSTPVKMKLGAPPGARFTVPTQLHKVNTEPFRKFQLPSLQQNKNSSYKASGQLKLPQISVGKSHNFPQGNFSAFTELLLRTKLRFKSDHGYFTWPKFCVMNLNSRDLHETCSS